MAQKQTLQQENRLQQVQQQTLSAQQVIAVRLTEMSLDALRERVENECMENPWLEKESEPQEEMGWDDGPTSPDPSQGEGHDDRAADYRTPDDIPDYLLHSNNGDGTPETTDYGQTQTFYDMLMEQVKEYDLTDRQRQLLEYLIGSLDDDGLLKKDLQQLADEMGIYQGIDTTPNELREMLRVLWQFDPPGVGARSLQECLLIQVRRNAGIPHRKELEDLLQHSFDDFIHKRWDRIRHRMKLSAAQAASLQREVVKLNPRPGSSLGEQSGQGNRQITPDFFVETDDEGHIIMNLNQGDVPSIIISPDAREKLGRYEKNKARLSRSEEEDLKFTRHYVEWGQVFINALAMRRESMMRTMKAIIRLQEPFFREGDETLLRPMILEDVSALSGVSISVVSRVCNSKYVQTPYGTYPLKWFFSHKAKASDGDDVSNRKVMAALKELIDGEDCRNPLNDGQLADMMISKGFPIARRTVAKYREQMGIPTARMRK